MTVTVVRLCGIGESPSFCQSSRGRNAVLFRHLLECGVEKKRQNNAYREVPTCICSYADTRMQAEPKYLISLLPYNWKAKSAKSRALPFASSSPLFLIAAAATHLPNELNLIFGDAETHYLFPPFLPPPSHLSTGSFSACKVSRLGKS